MTMAFAVQHVHIKTNDPKETVQFYIDNFGATMKREVPGHGFQLLPPPASQLRT
jgi:catechol-2,3-dioxygenase